MSGVEITLRVGAGAVARLRAQAARNGWEVVQVRHDGAHPGARPMLATTPGTVAEAVRLHDAGLSLRAIAADLNARGLPGALGGRWWPRTVQAALRQARRAAKGPRGG